MAKKTTKTRRTSRKRQPASIPPRGASIGALRDAVLRIGDETGTTVVPTPTAPSAPPVPTFTGGTQRSEIAAHYHSIPSEFLRRLAQRFALGARNYGQWNWRKSLSTGSLEDARPFLEDVYNHTAEHLAKALERAEPGDDHLAAAAWGLSVLAYAEKRFSRPWQDLIGIPEA